MSRHIENSGVAVSEIKTKADRIAVYDTDWWTDIDDAIGLRLALWGEKLGAFDLAGVVINTALTANPSSVDSVLCADGRYNVPIASVTDYAPLPYYLSSVWQESMYDIYPEERGLLPNQCIDPVKFYRQLFATADRPIDIMQVGYLNAISAFLDSPADEISPLTGIELVAQNPENTMWSLAGNWENLSVRNNINRDGTASAAAINVFTNWPCKIIASETNHANKLYTGANLSALIADGRTELQSDPIYKGLVAYKIDKKGRPSWDPLTVLACIAGDPTKAGFDIHRGDLFITQAVTLQFTPDVNSKHAYLTVSTGVNDKYFLDTINSALVFDQRLSKFPKPTPSHPEIDYGFKYPRTGLGSAELDYANSYTATQKDKLLYWFHADDLANDFALNDPVTVWSDRINGMAVRAPSASAPTLAQAVDGASNALQFSGAQGLKQALRLRLPLDHTILVSVDWQGVNPTGEEAILTVADITNNIRRVSLRNDGLGNIVGHAYKFDSYLTESDSQSYDATVDTGWQVMGLYMSTPFVDSPSTTLKSIVKGVAGAGKALSANYVSCGDAPLSIGEVGSGSLYATCAIREVRIYEGDVSADLAAIVAEMSV